MSNRSFTYQQVETISVKRNKILEISTNPSFTKNDYKVFLLLLTQLEGYAIPLKGNYTDPMNFKIIDIKTMSDTIGISKKKVKKSIDDLCFEGILEEGSNDTIKKGYRFTF